MTQGIKKEMKANFKLNTTGIERSKNTSGIITGLFRSKYNNNNKPKIKPKEIEAKIIS